MTRRGWGLKPSLKFSWKSSISWDRPNSQRGVYFWLEALLRLLHQVLLRRDSQWVRPQKAEEFRVPRLGWPDWGDQNQVHCLVLHHCEDLSNKVPKWVGIALPVLLEGICGFLLQGLASSWRTSVTGMSVARQIGWHPWCEIDKSIFRNTCLFSCQLEQSLISRNFWSAIMFSFPGKYWANCVYVLTSTDPWQSLLPGQIHSLPSCLRMLLPFNGREGGTVIWRRLRPLPGMLLGCVRGGASLHWTTGLPCGLSWLLPPVPSERCPIQFAHPVLCESDFCRSYCACELPTDRFPPLLAEGERVCSCAIVWSHWPEDLL